MNILLRDWAAVLQFIPVFDCGLQAWPEHGPHEAFGADKELFIFSDAAGVHCGTRYWVYSPWGAVYADFRVCISLDTVDQILCKEAAWRPQDHLTKPIL